MKLFLASLIFLFTFFSYAQSSEGLLYPKAERSYRLFDSAGEYAVAWGCRDAKVDFTKFDYNELYRNKVLENCVLENYIINLYENRILETVESEYFPNRAMSMNHHSKGIKSLGLEATGAIEITGFNGDVSAYALWEGWKWEGADSLLISLLPYSADNSVQLSELYRCLKCNEFALALALNKLGWGSRTQGMAWTIHFSSTYEETTYESFIVGDFGGVIPKNGPSAEIKAYFKMNFDYFTKKFELSLVKIKSSSIEQE